MTVQSLPSQYLSPELCHVTATSVTADDIRFSCQPEQSRDSDNHHQNSDDAPDKCLHLFIYYFVLWWNETVAGWTCGSAECPMLERSHVSSKKLLSYIIHWLCVTSITASLKSHCTRFHCRNVAWIPPYKDVLSSQLTVCSESKFRGQRGAF